MEHFFVVHGGETNTRGKVSWPDTMCVQMSKKEALHKISEMAHAIADSDTSTVVLCFCGQIEFDSED